jgi:tryptophan synthase alpha chain
LLPAKNVLVGFGISSPEIAKTFASISDGVIVGSSIIKSLIEDGSKQTIEKIKSLKAAITT